jgi:hypothetical protein
MPDLSTTVGIQKLGIQNLDTVNILIPDKSGFRIVYFRLYHSKTGNKY